LCHRINIKNVPFIYFHFSKKHDLHFWQSNGRRYWQVRELAGKGQSAESAVGAESPKVWAKPALVRISFTLRVAFPLAGAIRVQLG